MKFRVKKDEFALAVAAAAKTTSPQNAGGVLAGVLLETNNGSKLRLSGFDQETATKGLIDATVETEGKAVLPAQMLSSVARSLPNEVVTIEIDDSRAVVTSGKAVFRLPVLPVADYPELPKLPAASGKVAADVFAAAVAQVAIATGKDASIPALTAVRVEVDGDKLTLVATDRYRLAMRQISWDPADPDLEASILVPKAALVETSRSFGTVGSPVTVGIGGIDGESASLVGFANADRALITRQVEGEFPRYRGLLPEEFASAAVVENDVLNEALKRAGIVVNATLAVRLTFSENLLKLEAGEGESAEHTEDIECEYSGEEFTIAFNPTFLAEGIGAAGTERITISLNGAQKPAVITGVGSEEDYRYLLMPVRIG